MRLLLVPVVVDCRVSWLELCPCVSDDPCCVWTGVGPCCLELFALLGCLRLIVVKNEEIGMDMMESPNRPPLIRTVGKRLAVLVVLGTMTRLSVGGGRWRHRSL